MECFLKKYSPKNIEDFNVDNIPLLKSNLNFNILICGNNGTGKTSILINLINKYLNYNSNIYFDDNVLFMNNLKEQGIQFCRSNVKVFCQTPSNNKSYKKIIAIDDIDEFSDVSQQVICNYINKYSDNIIFFSTCTNTLKVYDGLKSRMFIVNMIHPTYNILEKLCKTVLLSENIILNDKYFADVIESSNCSYKILLNTLFKMKIYDDIIDDNSIHEILTTINYQKFNKYIEYIKNKDINKSLNIIFTLAKSGMSVIDILYEFTIYIKYKNNLLTDYNKYEIITLVSKYITIFHDLHEDIIELAFLTNELIYKLTND